MRQAAEAHHDTPCQAHFELSSCFWREKVWFRVVFYVENPPSAIFLIGTNIFSCARPLEVSSPHGTDCRKAIEAGRLRRASKREQGANSVIPQIETQPKDNAEASLREAGFADPDVSRDGATHVAG